MLIPFRGQRANLLTSRGGFVAANSDKLCSQSPVVLGGHGSGSSLVHRSSHVGVCLVGAIISLKEEKVFQFYPTDSVNLSIIKKRKSILCVTCQKKWQRILLPPHQLISRLHHFPLSFLRVIYRFPTHFRLPIYKAIRKGNGRGWGAPGRGRVGGWPQGKGHRAKATGHPNPISPKPPPSGEISSPVRLSTSTPISPKPPPLTPHHRNTTSRIATTTSYDKQPKRSRDEISPRMQSRHPN